MSESRVEDLERLLKAGGISRREFLARAAALGAGAAAMTSLGCSANAPTTPRQGGRLRIGSAHGSTTDSLDPATYDNAYCVVLGYAIRNCLTELNPEGKLVPELAESFEATPDARQWTFRLRKDVEFHNGKTLEAGDIIASLNHHRGKTSKSIVKTLLDPVAGLKADGKDTVIVTLQDGNVDFAYIMSDYHLPIMPAKDGAPDWQSGTGTGGYVLDGFAPGVRARFKRFPNYFKEGHAHVDEAELLSIIDVSARTNALKAGEVDVISRCDVNTVHLLARDPNIKVAELDSTGHYSIPMRTDMAPFDNNDVRLALKYGIDRQAMLDTILRGHGTLGNDHPISALNRYHARELPQRQYDPDKARFHLKKAGLSTLKVPLHVADAAFAGAVNAAVLFKERAAKAGITIDVQREPNDGYWDNVWFQKPWCMTFWAGRPTEDWMFSAVYASGAPWNETYWKHERFNQLLLQARSERDEAKRREMYVEMQRIVSDEGGVVVPVFNNHIFAMSKKVGHGTISKSEELDGAKAIERWWFV